MIARLLAVALGVLVGLAAGVPAASADTNTVTLEATRTNLTYGQQTTLSGQISPAQGGQTVTIVDITHGEVVDDPITEPDGTFSTQISPNRNMQIQSEWLGAASDPLDILVTPVIEAGLSRVLLFGKARVSGKVRPEHQGEKVEVRLMRNGKQAGRRQATLNGDGKFRTGFYIGKPGRYRAVATFDDADHERARDRSPARATPLPTLREGSKRIQVLLLERRLRRLNYYIAGIDRRYDRRTGDAVLAFHKVQGMSRVRSVGDATWRRLSDPRRPRPKVRRPRHHIEINQSKQVLYVVDRGKISWILHTSTGAGGATHDGVFRVHRKLAGYSPNRLYYPSYFDGNRAVHGWPEVPSYPASHGCSRVPMWMAIWIHNRMPIGTVVRVYH